MKLKSKSPPLQFEVVFPCQSVSASRCRKGLLTPQVISICRHHVHSHFTRQKHTCAAYSRFFSNNYECCSCFSKNCSCSSISSKNLCRITGEPAAAQTQRTRREHHKGPLFINHNQLRKKSVQRQYFRTSKNSKNRCSDLYLINAARSG